jgi:hypothetical protein
LTKPRLVRYPAAGPTVKTAARRVQPQVYELEAVCGMRWCAGRQGR